eukprot:36107_1
MPRAKSNAESDTESGVDEIFPWSRIRRRIPDKCKKCKQFYVNDKLEGFCSICFMNIFGKEKYFMVYPSSKHQHLTFEEIASIYKQHDRKKYSEPLQKIGIVEPIANMITDYCEYPSDEYYYYLCKKYSRVKKQTKFDQWIEETIHNEQILSFLKKMINKFDYKCFADLLCALQPWMSINNVVEIINAIDENKQLVWSPNRDSVTKIDTVNKIVGLLYFSVDIYVDNATIFHQISRTLSKSRHGINVQCSFFYNKGIGRKEWFGRHVLKGHILEGHIDDIPPKVTKKDLFCFMKDWIPNSYNEL